jgi:iron complex outermembrane receptor protein
MLLTLCLLSYPSAAGAQEQGRIEGTVTMQATGDALHGARVLLLELSRSVLSDLDGNFAFDGVPPGTYQLLAVREHLQAARTAVEVTAGATSTVTFALTLSAVHEDVTVTATGRETTVFDAFSSVQVLDSVDIAKNMGATLGELLENEPGMAKRSFGPGSARPIIRGFDNDRVLIMQDGIRTGDLSAQSGDHGTSIDPGSLQKVEILKGPATLLYGSNAIGGVVNTISPQQQFYDHPPDELRGQVNADLGSTNGQAGGSGNFQYGDGNFMAWFGGGARRTGSYSSPEGEIENSQTEQANGRFGLGVFGDTSHISASYQIEDGVYGVPFAGDLHGEHDDAGGGHDAEDEVLIDLDQRRQVVRIDGGLHELDAGFIEGVTGVFSYIDWNHKEIEKLPDGASEVGTEFFNKTTIGRLEVEQSAVGRLTGQFGLWGQHRDYKAVGEEALSPPVKQDAFAGFAYEELLFDSFSLQFGGRLEHNRYRPEDRAVGASGGTAPDVRDRSFTGFSGSVGVRVPLSSDRVALVGNLSSSYRAPSLEELYNFGAHVGTLSFEIGNPDLAHERSTGGEISLRLNTGKLHGQASVFYYDINDYIFGAPTGRTVDGLTELRYVQGDSRYLGSDLSLSFHASAQWRFHLGAGVVDAKLKGSNEPLPRIPPLSTRLAVDWLPTNGLQLRPELILTSKQDKTFDTETATAGSTVLNMSASYTVARAKLMHIFTLKGTNLTNTLYRNHTSFIKDVAPEMGRRVLLTYALRLF